ncbi:MULTISPECIES: hypothetical protein [Cohnella]|uniref:Uncharacterized protein n=1 Tax=Cohnella fermenti TaxID=2565925 RepID=A0A4V3WE88_9BACL|nr:hypothetical protein [Cohnella fermenti]THF75370.1 hypothetical protein E6C55_22250 [Cohnella fermenti]
MAGIKKITLDNQLQEKLWSLIHNEDEVIADVLGTEVKLTVISSVPHDQREIIKEIESDPELQTMLKDSEEDEKAGRNYSVEEAIKYIQEFHAE